MEVEEGHQLELAVRLPASMPLRPPEVECRRKVSGHGRGGICMATLVASELAASKVPVQESAFLRAAYSLSSLDLCTSLSPAPLPGGCG